MSAPGTSQYDAINYFWQCVKENKPFEWQYSKEEQDRATEKFKKRYTLMDNTVDKNL